MMSHCSFCLQLCQVRPVRKQLSSLRPDSPACLWLPPALLSPLLKHSLRCCVCVSFIGHISQDQTSMEDVWVMPFGIPLMKPFLTGLHGWLEHRLLLVHGLSGFPSYLCPSWVLVSIYLSSCLGPLIVFGSLSAGSLIPEVDQSLASGNGLC